MSEPAITEPDTQTEVSNSPYFEEMFKKAQLMMEAHSLSQWLPHTHLIYTGRPFNLTCSSNAQW